MLAYSNGSGPERSLVLYHLRFASTKGRIRESAAYARKAPNGSRRLIRRSLAEGLGLPNEPGAFVVWRDARSGLEYLHACRDIWERGLAVSLDAYGTHVFWEFRELRDGAAGQWTRLATRLAGRGVPSLDEALREAQLEPVHAPLRAVFADGLAAALVDGTANVRQLDDLERRFAGFLAAVAAATGVDGDPDRIAGEVRERAERVFTGAPPSAAIRPARGDRAALLAWLGLGRTGALAPGADVAATSLAWYDDLRLPGALVVGLHDTGFGEGEAWAIADLVRVLLALPRPSVLRGPARTADARLLDAWLADATIRVAIGLNTWEGVEYLDRDRFGALLGWAVRLDDIDAGPGAAAATAATVPPAAPDLSTRLTTAAEAAGYRVERLRAALAPRAAPEKADRTAPKPRSRKRTTER